MPRLQLPYTDLARLAFLKRAVQTAAQDRAAGHAYLSLETEEAIAAFLPAYEVAVTATQACLSARSGCLRTRAAAIAQVATCTRDIWEVVRRRVARLGQPAEVLTFYGLPLTGTPPKSAGQEEWLERAAHIVAGDARAVAAGYPPMQNPSAAELDAVLQAALQAARTAPAADRAYDEAQEQSAALRSRANALVRDVIAELRFALRRKDEPSQRRIMRSYGVVFRYLKDDPLEPDEDQPPEIGSDLQNT
jgi:hypothetical protein